MTMTELGSAFKSGPGPGIPTGFMESMIAQVVTQVVNAIGVQRPPVVNVTSPSVNVAAPNVAVDPHITLQERENTPEVTVNVDFTELTRALNANTESLTKMRADIQSLVVIMQKPVTKSVHRGNGGLIDTVTETR